MDKQQIEAFVKNYFNAKRISAPDFRVQEGAHNVKEVVSFGSGPGTKKCELQGMNEDEDKRVLGDWLSRNY